jgi:hypothetical protein
MSLRKMVKEFYPAGTSVKLMEAGERRRPNHTGKAGQAGQPSVGQESDKGVGPKLIELAKWIKVFDRAGTRGQFGI